MCVDNKSHPIFSTNPAGAYRKKKDKAQRATWERPPHDTDVNDTNVLVRVSFDLQEYYS